MHIPYLAIPMRAQPFHCGHERLLRQLSQICRYGVVFLNCAHDENNPFSFPLRKRWVAHFLRAEHLTNIIVVERRHDLAADRFREYTSYFPTDDIVVLSTNETDVDLMRKGFRTLNHHAPQIREYIWPESTSAEELHGFGAIIRARLRKGLDCSRYLSPHVEREARDVMVTSSTTPK